MNNQATILKALREGTGLSQRDLAKEAGISRGTIGDIERGASGFSLEISDKLAKVIASRIDMAYVAGLFDRKSSISVTKLEATQIYNAYNTRVNPHYRVKVCFYSKHRLLVDVIHKVMEGLGGVVPVKLYGNNAGSPYWSYYAQCKMGRDVLEKLQPYIKLKKPQVDLILQLGDLQNSNRHNYLCDKKGKVSSTERLLTPEHLAKMEAIYLEVKRLNKAL